MIFVWSHRRFPTTKKLSVTQTILIFYIWRRMCVNFLKYSIDFLVVSSFSSMLVENDRNLMIEKMFCIQLWLKIVFGDLVSICYVTCIYLFYIELFWSEKKNIFLLVLRSKSMFCENYFMSQLKNIGSIEIFPHISFSRLLCFSFNKVVFKRFPCVRWSFEACFWEKK